MFNNYQKMKEMESVLVSVLPEGVRGTAESQAAQSGDKLVIEEVKGNVYPTSPQENGGGILEQGRPVGKTEIPASQEAESAGYPAPDQAGDGSADKSQEEGAAAGQEGSQETGGADETLSGAPALSGETETQSPPQTAAAGAQITAEGSEGEAAAQAGEEEALQTPPSGEAENTGGSGKEAAQAAAANMKPGKSYIVGEGETLYGICFKLYKSLDYLEDICALNGLDDVNKIKAGQKLTLPDLQ